MIAQQLVRTVATLCLYLIVIAPSANAQTAGKLIVEVKGEGSVAVKGALVLPKMISDTVITNTSPQEFQVTRIWIWDTANFRWLVELRNPIAEILGNRFIWRDSPSNNHVRGMKIVYDSTVDPPKWTATALDSSDKPLPGTPCQKMCDGVMLYGTTTHPPCCPTPSGYDCNCSTVRKEPAEAVSTACCDPCCRPKRCRRLLSLFRCCY